MAGKHLVVARYRNGNMVKGMLPDFNPGNTKISIITTSGVAISVNLEDLKALFFVKNLEGNTNYEKTREFHEDQLKVDPSKKIAIHFKDGELLTGYTDYYAPHGQGFLVYPADTRGNNIRAYVINAAVNYASTGSQADELAESAPQKHKPATMEMPPRWFRRSA